MTRIATTTTPNSGATIATAYLALRENKPSVSNDLDRIAKILGARNWKEVNWTTLDAANVRQLCTLFRGAHGARTRLLGHVKGIVRSGWRMGIFDTETLVRINDIVVSQ